MPPGHMQVVELDIGIGPQNPRIVIEMATRMLSAAVLRRVEQRRRWRRTAKGLVVADLGPQPADDGLSLR
jgi:hypothetical protein